MGKQTPRRDDGSQLPDSEALVDQIEQLVWSLLDDQISISQLQRLETVIRDDPVARATYLDCVRMHVDLTEHFAKSAKPRDTEIEAPARTPNLGFLGELPDQFGAAPPLPGTPTL